MKICPSIGLLLMAIMIVSVQSATLVARYNFDGNTNDLSGMGNHGVNYGASFAPGISGQGLSFDGNDYVRAADSASLDISGSFSLSIWLKTNASSNGQFAGLLAKHYTHNNRSYGLFLTDARGGYFELDNTSNIHYSVTDSLPLNDGQWHNVTGTYNQSTGWSIFYVDGVARASSNVGNQTLMNSSVPLLIGAYALSSDGYSNRDFFTGILDEASVYSGALDSTEVLALYNAYNVPEPGILTLMATFLSVVLFRMQIKKNPFFPIQ